MREQKGSILAMIRLLKNYEKNISGKVKQLASF